MNRDLNSLIKLSVMRILLTEKPIRHDTARKGEKNGNQ
jgi:hypothetical protein